MLPLPGSRVPGVGAYESLLRADGTEPQVPSSPWVPAFGSSSTRGFSFLTQPSGGATQGSPPPPARLRPPRADLVAALVSTG